jgi:hypothetical protein
LLTYLQNVILSKYRIIGQSGASVRADINLDSPLIANLEKDTIVEVLTIKGRRAEIVSPVKGWASTRTETGYVIMQKETGLVYRYKVILKDGAIVRDGPNIDSSNVRFGVTHYIFTFQCFPLRLWAEQNILTSLSPMESCKKSMEYKD